MAISLLSISSIEVINVKISDGGMNDVQSASNGCFVFLVMIQYWYFTIYRLFVCVLLSGSGLLKFMLFTRPVLREREFSSIKDGLASSDTLYFLLN